jgi:hypothetical protein
VSLEGWQPYCSVCLAITPLLPHSYQKVTLIPPPTHTPQRFSRPGWRIGSTTFLEDFPSTVALSSRVTLAPLIFMLELNPLEPLRISSSRSSRFNLWMFALEKLISYRAVRPSTVAVKPESKPKPRNRS